MNLQNTETLNNLVRAYHAEIHSGTRYQFLQQMAVTNKQYSISKVLQQLSTNEMAHAKVYWDLIKEGTDDKAENINLKAGFNYKVGEFIDGFKIASEIENEEAESIYIEFAKTAEKENFPEVAEKFKMIAKIEGQHRDTLQTIYKDLSQNTLYKKEEEMVWKCHHCGHIHTSKSAWKTCPVCGMNQGYATIQLCPAFFCATPSN